MKAPSESGRAIVFLVGACLLLLLSSSALPSVHVAGSESAAEYTYYGVIPGTIRFARKSVGAGGYFEIIPGSVARSAFVCVVAPSDDTHVKVYVLPEKTLAYEATLDAMEKMFFSLPNGTFFKVVSDKIVTVEILGWGPLDLKGGEGPTPFSFYITTGGGYVGKEFVFIASQWASNPAPYKFIALEDAEVTITREDGLKQSFKLSANTVKTLGLKPLSAYRVQSTGNIMIQSSGLGRWEGACEENVRSSFYVPSAEGGFLGRRFYTRSATSWAAFEDVSFRIMAPQKTKVRVWDIKFNRPIMELEIEGGKAADITPTAELIAIESEKPVTFAYIFNGSMGSEEAYLACSYNSGVTFIGVKANEETPFFIPSNSSIEAYVFASEDAVVKIDDLTMPIKADSYLKIDVPGAHRIISDKNVVIQITHWPKVPAIQGLKSFGAVVPCVETVDLKPAVRLSPLGGGEGFPTTYLIAGVAVAAAAAAALMVMRRRAG
jgi:hypothetical protein